MAFLDYGSAFAALLHGWIFFVFEHMGFPIWLLVFIRHMYCDGNATIFFKGKRYRNVLMKCGVRQGCPASSSIFVLAVDPLIRWIIAKILRPGDELRVFADDKGFALKQLLVSLPIMARAFRLISVVTGLSLNIKKCVIVITGDIKPDYLKDWIAIHAPFFVNIQIAYSGKYLGIHLGRNAC